MSVLSESVSVKYVCLVLSYQTCQIHMSIVFVDSVAFVLKAECTLCTKAKHDCNVTIASGNV
jgi:hypothetical protein